MKKIITFISVFILVIALSFVCAQGKFEKNSVLAASNSEASTTDAKNASKKDEKILSKASLADDFDDSTLLVVLDKQTSKINKKLGKLLGDFSESQITDLTQLNETNLTHSNIRDTGVLSKEAA